MGVLRFLCSATVWAIFTSGPVLGLILRSGITTDDLCKIPFLLFISIIQAGLLWPFVSQAMDLSEAIRWGAIVGFVLPTALGYLLGKDIGSFDAQGFTAVGLVLGVPSAVGGAVAGWIQWRAKPALA